VDLYWIGLAEDGNSWWAFVNVVMKIRVPKLQVNSSLLGKYQLPKKGHAP